MRILSISGEGIRSLAAPFRVDFSSGPLAQGGLFAIVGPTGAGKSTLLDTLCLALYGRVPRVVAKVGGVRIQEGDNSLSESDPRTCLSHGVGEGRAEVEFAIGTRRYRATWRVHRARLRPEGRLQNDRMEMTDLVENRTLADKKKDVEALVMSLTGLDFDQFQRSAMLAQGQFARFLEAGEKERADLLETITGETVYTQLSVAAYEKAQRLVRQREMLQAQAGALPLPSPEAYELATVELAQAEDARAAAEATRDALAAEMRWYLLAADLRRKAQEAQVEAAAADQAWLDFQPSLAELTRGAKARELRAESEALAGATQRFHAAEAQVEMGQRNREMALAGLELARQGEAVAVAELGAAKRAQREGQGDISRARELDGQVAQGRVRLADGQRESAAALEAATAAKGAWERLCQQRDRTQARAERAETWLADHAQVRAIAEQAPLVRDALQGIARLERADTVASNVQARGEMEKTELAQRVAQAQEHLRQARDALFGRLGLDVATTGSEALSQAIARVRGEALHALEAARQEIQRAQLLVPAKGLREGLVRGKACPVCGATEHPFAVDPLEAPELDTPARVLEAARLRVEETESLGDQRLALESLAVGLERLQNLLAESERKGLAVAAERAALATQLEAHQRRLDPLLGPWRATWEGEDPQRLWEELEGLLSRWANDATDLAAAREDLAALAPALAVAEAAHMNQERERARLMARDEENQRHLATLRQARGGVLDGREVEAVLAEWEAQIVAREETWARSRLAVQEAGAALVEAETREETAQQALMGAKTELERTAAQWDSVLARASLPEAEVAELLARGEEWYQGLRGVRDRLKEAQVRCARTLEIRREELASHDAMPDRPQRPMDAVEAALKDARLTADKADGEVMRRFAIHQGMAEARVQASRLMDELTLHDELAAPWMELSELMGSADGARFRKFAQGLALVQLLGLANAQMTRLKPRYVITRVPGTDLEIAIVDRHQADQIRPVSSLSGGETFLVSLALALGLAQLTGGGSPIQSLFIDEGFGALDQETLDDALETLDLLQSEGKTIGIISHVEALRERIASQIVVVPKDAGRSELEVRF